VLADSANHTWDTVNEALVLGTDPGGTARLRVGGLAVTNSGLLSSPTLTALLTTFASGGTPRLQCVGANAVDSSIGLARFSATTGNGARFLLARSNNATPGVFGATADGNLIGGIDFQGVDTTAAAFRLAAGIFGFQEGAAGATSVPSRVVVQTTAVGASTTTNAWQWNNLQQGMATDGVLASPGLSWISDPDTGLRRVGANNVRMVMGGVDITDWTTTTFTALLGLTLTDAKDITISGATGSKIGQAGSKIGIYGKAPVTQPAVPAFAATTTVAVAGAVYTAVEQAMLGTLKADVIALRASIVALCNRFDQSAAAVGILSGTGA
jgi:hypothetical protein